MQLLKLTQSFFVFFCGISSFYPHCHCGKCTDKETNILNHSTSSDLLVACHLFFTLLSCYVYSKCIFEEMKEDSHAEVIFYDSVHVHLR